MNQFILLLFLYMTIILCPICSAEKKVNSDIDSIMNHTPLAVADYSILCKYFDKIMIGTSILSTTLIPIGASVIFISLPFLHLLSYALAVLTISGSIAMIAIGSVLLGHGIYRFSNHYRLVPDKHRELFLNHKSKNYLRIGIATAAVSGASFLTVMAGVAMHIAAYFKPSVLMMFGIIPDVIGGLGLLVCLPMMIASLAMSAWCKGQLAQISPDISLTHDDGKTFSEGYGVSLGLRVRL